MKKEILRPSVEQLAARARAMRVLPVPGGPWKRTPRGGVTWKRWKISGYRRGRVTISLSWFMSRIRMAGVETYNRRDHRLQ